MKYSTLKVTFLFIALISPTVAIAQEPDNLLGSESNPMLGWLSSDMYRVSFGFGSLKLHNPEGFDVPIETYSTGSPTSSTTRVMFNIIGERAIGWNGRQKRLWNLHYDSEDYNGLKLNSLTLGAGVAISPAQVYAYGGRLAIGANAGITRSASFFDSAIHPAAELWVSAGVQLGRFTMDISVRERQTLRANLDIGNVAPGTQTNMLSFGALF